MSHCAATIVNACLGEMSCQGSVNQRGVSYFQKLLAFGVEPLCSYREKLCFQLTRPLMGLNMTSRVLPAMLLIGLCCLLQPSTSQADPESYADIVEKVMPSVVNISIESAGERCQNRRHGQHSILCNLCRRAGGAGSIIDPSGIIATNKHVVNNAYSITVTLQDGSAFPAQLLGKGVGNDLAMLKTVDGRPLPPPPKHHH